MRRFPKTFWIGLALIALCEALLFYDVISSHRRAVHSDFEIARILRDRPTTFIDNAARLVAINMTALVWPAYLLLLDGILKYQNASPVRVRPHHFLLLCLASIFIWCVFDAVNFRGGMRAWEYIGMPHRFSERVFGYLLAFACVVPSMLLSGQVLMNLGVFDRLRSRSWNLPTWGSWLVLVIGALMCIWPLAHPRPITNLTLWTSLVFFLDPINFKLGRPSLLRDWTSGWYGRTVALFAGGLLCGFLWEFWNYWALAKWVYHLDFLGPLEHMKYFEMPVVGLVGFIAFGPECWVMWQSMRIPLDGLCEQLPDDSSLL